jgi:3-keto-L-gulonate-6-phosphate decarboxylase
MHDELEVECRNQAAGVAVTGGVALDRLHRCVDVMP